MASNTTSNMTSNTPPFVEPDMDNGCETGACELAKLFYTKNERVVRRLRFRRELSDFYLATFNAWAPSEVITNPALHRTFSQVLYALVNDGKVLRISNSRLLWINNSPPNPHPRHRPRHQPPHQHHSRPRRTTHKPSSQYNTPKPFTKFGSKQVENRPDSTPGFDDSDMPPDYKKWSQVKN